MCIDAIHVCVHYINITIRFVHVNVSSMENDGLFVIVLQTLNILKGVR